MKNIIISIDAGKYELKSIGRDLDQTAKEIKRVNFRSKLYDLSDGFMEAEGNSFNIGFEGKSYILGEAGQYTDDETSKTSILHKLSSYVAITKFLEPNTNENNIYVVLACPLSIVKNSEAKEEYKSFIKGNGSINIEVDGEHFNFEIKEIMIKSEGSGIVNLKPELFKNTTTTVFDFGGLNLNVCVYTNAVADTEARFTLEYGSTKLVTLTADRLTSFRKGRVVNYDTAEKAIDDGYLIVQDEPVMESAPVIKESKIKFLESAITESKRRGIDIRDTGLVCVGGTTEKIKDVLSSLPATKHAYIPTDAQWATCEGNFRVAVKKYGKTN